MGPIKLIFLDIPAGVAVEETFDVTTKFYDLTSLLSRMSGSVCEQIKGLGSQHQVTDKGFDSFTGCWWYRIVKVASAPAQQIEATLPQHIKGDWCRLANNFTYECLCNNELARGLGPEEGWVEIQHDLQKKRDELTTAKAQDQDKDWRSSIGHSEASPQDNNADFQFTSVSASVTNTSNTSLYSQLEKGNIEQRAKSRKDTETASVGSCISTKEVENLPEFSAQVQPLGIEWPKPPRCVLLHVNEDHVAEDAESRNHHPVPYSKFTVGEKHTNGLPSYTPRPGPFPAQIGSPPSAANFCAYEICNDISYDPSTPIMENGRTQRPPSSQALHDDSHSDGRSFSNVAPLPQAPAVNMTPLQTSISVPDQHLRYDPRNNLFEHPSHPMQSAPAHMQTFPQPQPSWVGFTRLFNPQQFEHRFLSLEQHRPASFCNAPDQGKTYLGSQSYETSRLASRQTYPAQPMQRSSGSPEGQHQFSMAPISPFSNRSAVRHPSHPFAPQDGGPHSVPPRHSNYQDGVFGPGTFSGDPFGVNTDAMKESDILALQARSQQYHASYRTSPQSNLQATPAQYPRSNSAVQSAPGSYQQSRTTSAPQNQIRVLLPGFSRTGRETAVPSYANADHFSKSLNMIPRSIDPSLLTRGPGERGNPALKNNCQAALEEQHQLRIQRSQMPFAYQQAMSPRMQRPVQADNICWIPSAGPERWQPSPSSGPKRYQSQPSYTTSYNQFFHRNKDSSNGPLALPKPRTAGKNASNVLHQYNPRGFPPSIAPEMVAATTPQATLDPPSLFDEVSAGLLDEYKSPRVALPPGQHLTRSKYMKGPDQVLPWPSSKSSVSNFSDEFVPTGKRGGRKIAQRKKKIAKRGTAREMDVIKRADKEESARKAQKLENERAPRVKRVKRVKTKSGGSVQMEMEKSVDSDETQAEKAVENDETEMEKIVEGDEMETEKVLEGDEMINEGY